MSDTKKPIRLADIGQLEEELRQDLAEEEAKGKAADILYCESISDTLSDLSNLPTIDLESVARPCQVGKGQRAEVYHRRWRKRQPRGTGNLLYQLQGQNLAERFRRLGLELLPGLRVQNGGCDKWLIASNAGRCWRRSSEVLRGLPRRV